MPHFRTDLAGLAASTVLAVLAVAAFYRQQPDIISQAAVASRLIDRNTGRLGHLRQYLPAHRCLGYLSDIEPSELTEYLRAFLSVQYALSPQLLADRTDCDWVVGVFYGRTDPLAEGHKHRLILVRDFSNGVALYRRDQ